jgi:hypothetical protein
MDTTLSAVINNPYKLLEKRQFELLDLFAKHGLTIPGLSHKLCGAIKTSSRHHVQLDERVSRQNRLLCKVIELRYGAASNSISAQDKIDDFEMLLEITDQESYAGTEPAFIVLLKNGVDLQRIDYGQSGYADKNIIEKLSQRLK